MDMQQETSSLSWRRFFWRITACHMVSYFLFGLLFSTLFHYSDVFATTDLAALMRPVSSPWTAAGPALQLFRGLLFALVLWPIKDVILGKRGWLKLWLLFLGLAVLGTAGPSPGSVEGLIYTRLPLASHILGLPEVLLQTLAFSLGFYFWYRRPGKTWNILMSSAVALILLMSAAGVFLR
jgi:hypothetical protein